MRSALHTAGFALAVSLTVSAQQIPEYSQYSLVPFLYNPAMAGSGTAAGAHLIRKDQWLDFPGSGSTHLLAIDGAIREKNAGFGLSLFHDEKGIMATSGAYASYAYRLRLGENSRLRFGISAGAADYRVDFSKAIVLTANDPMLTGEEQKMTVFDAGAGLAFSAGERFMAGLAVPQLLESTAGYKASRSDRAGAYRLSRHYVASVQYKATFGREAGTTLVPLVLVRVVPGAPLRMDGNLTIDFAKAGWLSMTWKSGYAAGAGAGLRIGKALKLGYSYDIILNGIRSYAGLSQEILIGFTFGQKEKENDVHTDSLVARLHASNEDLKRYLIENEQEIQRLRSRITQIINGAFEANDRMAESNERLVNDLLDSIQVLNDIMAGVGQKEKDKAETSFRTGSSKTFTDESGGAQQGYYIVVGAFRNKELADRQKASLKGGNAGILFHSESLFFYVYAGRNDHMEGAFSALRNIRKSGHPNAWIYLLR